MTQHLHRYAVMGVDFDPSGGERPRSPIARLFSPAPVGQTTISLRCEDCGDPATRVVAGRWQDGVAHAPIP